MSPTKQKIVQCAIELFNEKGLINVRLQHIADDARISVGNLAYHFHNKQAIVEAIDDELGNTIKPILLVEEGFSYLIDFDNQLSAYYYLIKRYAFYFLDFLELERSYPVLHAKRKDYIRQMVYQIKEWMLLNIEKGILNAEIKENQYQNTAHSIWMIITFWLTQQEVRGAQDEDEGAFKIMIWNQFVPLFTASGLMEYEAIILPQLQHHNSKFN
jgi:AcrR family transcriptional regulator